LPGETFGGIVRRTLITSLLRYSLQYFSPYVFRSLQLGSYDHMFRNAIESYTGYIQVQHRDFWDEKTVDNTFAPGAHLEERLLSDENVVATIPRFESFALASSGPQTKGVLVMGINPEKETHLSKVTDKMVKYRLSPESIEKIRQDPNLPDKVKELAMMFESSAYTTASRLQLDLGIKDKEAANYMPVIESYTRFKNGKIQMGEPGAWVGDKLSQYLQLGIGDTIVLISQGYHATTAAGKYEIKGIVKLPLPDIDNKIVYLPLDVCTGTVQCSMETFTSLALAVRDNNRDKAIAETVQRIRASWYPRIKR
jgi:ABC-type lipoprotein release transport system permease subunit